MPGNARRPRRWDVLRLAAGSGGAALVRLRRYIVENAWVSKFQGMPRLDSMSNEIGLINL